MNVLITGVVPGSAGPLLKHCSKPDTGYPELCLCRKRDFRGAVLQLTCEVGTENE